MNYSFKLSRLALNDLENIWHYTAENWSKEQANKYYREIFEVIEAICNNPDIGQSIDEIKKGHRRKIIASHMIIYKSNSETICIDRILHQKMSIEKHVDE